MPDLTKAELEEKNRKQALELDKRQKRLIGQERELFCLRSLCKRYLEKLEKYEGGPQK